MLAAAASGGSCLFHSLMVLGRNKPCTFSTVFGTNVVQLQVQAIGCGLTLHDNVGGLRVRVVEVCY